MIAPDVIVSITINGPGHLTVSVILPKTIVLDVATVAPDPIAVAYVNPVVQTASIPSVVLCEPEAWTRGRDVIYPMCVLEPPTEICAPALVPIAVLLSPLVLPYNALSPIAVLLSPLVLPYNARVPIAIFSSPVKLLKTPFMDSNPIAILLLALSLFSNALAPTAIFCSPF